MTGCFAAAARYGREMTIRSAESPSGRTARGFISPAEPDETKNVSRAEKPGRARDARYRLIAPPSAIAEGETGITVSAGGRIYELLRCEEIYVGSDVSHWEGVLRLKGGAGDA